MDPATMQQMLVQQLGSNPGRPGTVGGGTTGGPAMTGQTSGANLIASLAQKAVLMNALKTSQQQQAQRQANAMLPGNNAQVANDPAMQALQQPQLDPSVLAQMQPPVVPPVDPNAAALAVTQ